MIRIHLIAPVVVLLAGAAALAGESPLEIGSRRELFVDDFLIDKLTGGATLHLHEPQPREVVLITDRPWEGNTCVYYTVFQDGDLYRMYYRGSHFDEQTRQPAHREVTCYAESRDGIHWAKPELGLFEFDGSKQNNIVWDGVGTHNFTPFKDANPNCTPQAKYKALARGPGGLYAFQSPDAIHWSLMAEKPVITKGRFDSQNLAFWDSHAQVYREYHRGFRSVREIMTGTSDDFLNWTEPAFLEHPDAPQEHLYTNAILPYERAPHLLIGFPARFLPQTQQVEPLLISSRDGRTFHRWSEPVIPLTAPEDRDGNRSNYMAWGLVQLPDAKDEYSVYASEAYYSGPDSRLRRFTYRVDGFVSVRAGAGSGELLTKPLTFEGEQLVLNVATAPQGRVRVEIQDASGNPIDGFRLNDSLPLQGDSIEQTVAWQAGNDLSDLADRPVRIRFVLRDADLYSLQFRPAP